MNWLLLGRDVGDMVLFWSRRVQRQHSITMKHNDLAVWAELCGWGRILGRKGRNWGGLMGVGEEGCG